MMDTSCLYLNVQSLCSGHLLTVHSEPLSLPLPRVLAIASASLMMPLITRGVSCMYMLCGQAELAVVASQVPLCYEHRPLCCC